MKIMRILKKNKIFLRNILLLAVIVSGLLAYSGAFTVYQVLHDQNFSDGILIDGIDVSGMSYTEAEQLVLANSEKLLDNIHISLTCSGQIEDFDAADMGISLNTQEVLFEAYSYNKNENDSYEQRYDKTVAMSRGINFETQISIDETKLRDTLTQYASLYYTSAINAAACFSKDTCLFSYTTEQYGSQINVDALVDTITARLYKKDYSTIEINRELIYPTTILGDLKENTELIAEYETTAYYNANRNTNIQLICNAVDGFELKPGEVLSLNELTGERTAEKGYKAAPAIVNGITVDDIGGGVCQLAGTLYNAALLADLEIVERVRHTWPSNYLPIGQDATLNFDDKDLKIKNTSEYSIFISAKFENQKVTVKLYGQPLEEGVTIDIQNEILEELPPADTEIRYTSELPIGVRKTIRNAQNGYSVEVYRIYFKDGIEINRELVSWDIYPALNRIVLIGSDTYDK